MVEVGYRLRKERREHKSVVHQYKYVSMYNWSGDGLIARRADEAIVANRMTRSKNIFWLFIGWDHEG